MLTVKMTPRDPNKTARNIIIAELTLKLKELLPRVLKDTDHDSEQSLNATIGYKTDKYFDLKHDVFVSQDQYVIKWLQKLNDTPWHSGFLDQIKRSKVFKKYLLLFLKRSYLKHYDELSKTRPKAEDAEIWMGQNNANYGLLVSPRFNGNTWENDKSEIRAFRKKYFTIGHILETGLVLPDQNKKVPFHDLEHFLTFFTATLVRSAGSTHQDRIAELYCDFVRNSADPESVPFLIPEYRYAGVIKKHKYRLDFVIINPYTIDKTGFELSPWSTHGYLTRTNQLTQKQINEMARDNFEREMSKHRDFFNQLNIYTLIFTDSSLKKIEQLFHDEFVPRLCPDDPEQDISFQIMMQYM